MSVVNNPQATSQVPMAKFHKNNRRFEPSEDKKLKELIESYGDTDWTLIASMMPGRNRRQCKDRWEQYLSPNANNTPWTEEEEILLKNLVDKYGNDWVKIARLFEGRALPQVRNKWRTLKRRISKGYTMDKTVSLEPIQDLVKQEHQIVPAVPVTDGAFDVYCSTPENCPGVYCRLCGKIV